MRANAGSWGQMATSPQMRQEYGQRVLGPGIKSFTKGVATKTIPTFVKEGFVKPMQQYGTTLGKLATAPLERRRLESTQKVVNQQTQRNIALAKRLQAQGKRVDPRLFTSNTRASQQLSSQFGDYAQNVSQLTARLPSDMYRAVATFPNVTPLGRVGYGLSAGIGAISAKLQGQDPYAGAGEGMAMGKRYSLLTQFTNPIISSVASKFKGLANNKLGQQFIGRTVSAIGNAFLEDEALAKLENQRPGTADRLTSLAIGFVISSGAKPGKNDLKNFIKKELKKNDSSFKLIGDSKRVIDNLSASIEDAGKYYIKNQDPKYITELRKSKGLDPYGKTQYSMESSLGKLPDVEGKKLKPVVGDVAQPPVGDVKVKLPEAGVKARLRTETPVKLKPQEGVQQSQKAVLKGSDSSKAIISQEDKYAFNINKARLGLKGESAKKLNQVVETMRPVLEKRKGAPLTNKEIIRGGRKAQMLDQVMGREQAAEFSKQLQATRNFVKTMSKKKGITPEYLAQLDILSSTAADSGRKLRAFSVNAEDAGIKQNVLRDLKKLGIETDRLVQAGKNVDWDDAAQVTEFYRKFKPASFMEKLDEYRYVNMLSSPNTHIINFFSNFIQTGVVTPIEKTLTGQLDWVRSKLTGTEQKYFAKQGVDYTKAYYKSLPDGWAAFKKTLKGEGGLTKPDIDFLPTGTSKFHKLYTSPLRALEAGDQFFRKMTEAGELATGKSVKQAKNAAEYRLFRQKFDPQGKLGQGTVLKTWDKWNSAIQNLRRAPGGKWIVPFLQTPTNILKQGIEYSPLGITTLHGAKEPMAQLAKTIIGSTVFVGAYTAVNAGLTTWDAPTNENEKAEFYAAGLQPYSMKIGDKWVSYNKLGPLSYPIAMASALKWAEENGADEEHLKKMGEGLIGILQFFSDQSYVRGFGDWIDSARGDTYKLQRAITNIPSQLVPLRALQGWFARLIDPVYRKAGTPLESMATQVPFLSKTLEPYKTPEGGPSKRDFPLLNAFTPAKVTQEKSTESYDTYREISDLRSQRSKESKEFGEKSDDIYKEINSLQSPQEKARLWDKYVKDGTIDEKMAKKIKDSIESDKMGLTSTDKAIKSLGVVNQDRANQIKKQLDKLKTPQEKAALWNDYVKKKIITKEVSEQLKKMLK